MLGGGGKARTGSAAESRHEHPLDKAVAAPVQEVTNVGEDVSVWTGAGVVVVLVVVGDGVDVVVVLGAAAVLGGLTDGVVVTVAVAVDVTVLESGRRTRLVSGTFSIRWMEGKRKEESGGSALGGGIGGFLHRYDGAQIAAAERTSAGARVLELAEAVVCIADEALFERRRVGEDGVCEHGTEGEGEEDGDEDAGLHCCEK